MAVGIGATLGYFAWVSGLLAEADRAIEQVPGGIANLIHPIVLIAPYLATLFVAFVPLAFVRRARRQRVGAGRT